MISSLIAYCICVVLLYCAFIHFRKVVRRTDVDDTGVLYGFLCIIAAWIVAKMGGI